MPFGNPEDFGIFTPAAERESFHLIIRKKTTTRQQKDDSHACCRSAPLGIFVAEEISNMKKTPAGVLHRHMKETIENSRNPIVKVARASAPDVMYTV